MSDKLAAVLIRLTAPYEKAWGWYVRRQYRRGKFRRPSPEAMAEAARRKRPYGDPRDIGAGAVVARRRDAA